MSTKHFFNDATHLVDSALQSLTYTNPSIAFDSENRVIYHQPKNASQVSLVSGGGSGHEPSFAGLVGQGLLTAHIAGSIFASPSAEQIIKALSLRVESKNGILVTIMNYTGDVLNFGIAIEKAKADGLNVKMLVVGDDFGIEKKKLGRVGRRGIAGTVLVHKISGALAARNASLNEVYQVAKLAAENIFSIGASLARVHVPGLPALDSKYGIVMDTDGFEIGMGIHNEPGYGRVKTTLPELVKIMLSKLLAPDVEVGVSLDINSTKKVLLINNLGGVSMLEIGAITSEVVNQLKQIYKINPVRIYTGTYMSSLNGLGFSISLLNLISISSGPSMLELLDEPAEATGWAAPIRAETWDSTPGLVLLSGKSLLQKQDIGLSGLRVDPIMTKRLLTAALERLVAAEPDITRYDMVTGDGDCGVGLKRTAQAILKLLSSTAPAGDIVMDLCKIVQIIENNLDGTSGALYAIFINSMISNFRQIACPSEVTPRAWASVLLSSCKNLKEYTRAQPGDRTVIDALYPFVETLAYSEDLMKAAIAARKGAKGTKGMEPKLGRAVYVGDKGFEQVPDPGAWALSEFFLGLAGVSRDQEV